MILHKFAGLHYFQKLAQNGGNKSISASFCFECVSSGHENSITHTAATSVQYSAPSNNQWAPSTELQTTSLRWGTLEDWSR
jgi:hypothetical protein